MKKLNELLKKNWPKKTEDRVISLIAFLLWLCGSYWNCFYYFSQQYALGLRIVGAFAITCVEIIFLGLGTMLLAMGMFFAVKIILAVCKVCLMIFYDIRGNAEKHNQYEQELTVLTEEMRSRV